MTKKNKKKNKSKNQGENLKGKDRESEAINGTECVNGDKETTPPVVNGEKSYSWTISDVQGNIDTMATLPKHYHMINLGWGKCLTATRTIKPLEVVVEDTAVITVPIAKVDLST